MGLRPLFLWWPMKTKLLFTSLFLVPFYAASAVNSEVGTVQWYVDKRNSIARQNNIYQAEILRRSHATLTKGASGKTSYMPQVVNPKSLVRGFISQLKKKKNPYVAAAATAYGIYEGYCAVSGDVDWCWTPDAAENLPTCKVMSPIYGCGVDTEVTGGMVIVSVSGPSWTTTAAATQPPYTYPTLSGYRNQFVNAQSHPQYPLQSAACPPQELISYKYLPPILEDLTPPEEPGRTFHTVQMTRNKNISRRPQPPASLCLAVINTESTENKTSPKEAWVDWELEEEFHSCPNANVGEEDYTDVQEHNGEKYCFNPANLAIPLVASDLEDFLEEKPEKAEELPPEVMYDPQTGAAESDFFDSPKWQPISDSISRAFDAIARGTSQSTDSSKPDSYIPPELVADVEAARESFHKGEPFTDPFTNTTVDPVTPSEPVPYEPNPQVDVKVEFDWTDFPGITQDQYEESNQGWAGDLAGQLPENISDWSGHDDGFNTSILENPAYPSALPNFGLLWNLPTGGCVPYSAVISVASKTQTIVFDKHCPPYNEWGRPLIEWFLQICAALTILNIFNRTIMV